MHTAPTWRAFANAASNTLAVTRTGHAKLGSAVAQFAKPAQLPGLAHAALFARTPFAVTFLARVTLFSKMLFRALFAINSCASFNAITLPCFGIAHSKLSTFDIFAPVFGDALLGPVFRICLLDKPGRAL